ncbi:MAG TPA: hypothetical protein VLT61_11295 [Anaeromyxobacteraceae bacterium]|nr:hypothetical protein [Anaeromyxobacteraceae bacterium]
MSLRRYAPLALAALALGCKPDIEQRANATTVDYAAFNPPSMLPLPNDIALSQVAAFVDGPYAAYPCNLTGTAQGTALCAFARAGGFPASDVAAIGYTGAVGIGFLRGTLGADGAISYAPAPTSEAMDVANTVTGQFAGLTTTPTLGIVDLTAAAPVTTATAAFTAASGKLALTPSGGAWTAGHRYAVLVLGGARGPKTLTGGTYTAMPPFYILREAVIADLDLSKPENQGLFPGDAAAKAASGTALEALRASYETLYSIGGFGAAAAAMGLPFEDAISLQTFQIAPGTGTVTIGSGTEPATAPSVTGGAGVTALVDTFTLQSNLGTATVAAVTFDLTAGAAAVDTLFVSNSPACPSAPTPPVMTFGTSATVAANGSITIPMTTYPPAGLTAATTLYVCANTKAPGASTAVNGTVTSVAFFPGTTYTSATSGDSADAGLTVN